MSHPDPFAKSDDQPAQIGPHNPDPNIRGAFHTAASRETSKDYAAHVSPYREPADVVGQRRADKCPLRDMPSFSAEKLTEKELQADEARMKEVERLREVYAQSRRAREERLRSEWSMRHEIPSIIVSEDLWKDIRHG